MSQRVQDGARCVICGSEDIERNHVGGRNHVAWFTMPFCRSKHHPQFHALVTAAGINLEYTPDPRERLRRGIEACLLAIWILTQAQRELDSGHDQKITSASKSGNGDV